MTVTCNFHGKVGATHTRPLPKHPVFLRIFVEERKRRFPEKLCDRLANNGDLYGVSNVHCTLHIYVTLHVYSVSHVYGTRHTYGREFQQSQ